MVSDAHSPSVGELIRTMGERGEGSVSCSILVRRDEALLRLDHCNIGRAIERRRKRLALTPRPPYCAEPILQALRRHEPESTHLNRAGLRRLVLHAAADQYHGLGEHVV